MHLYFNLLGESGVTCHRGKLSHFHCKLKALIVINVSDKFEVNTSTCFKNIVSKVSLALCLHSVYDCDNLPL